MSKAPKNSNKCFYHFYCVCYDNPTFVCRRRGERKEDCHWDLMCGGCFVASSLGMYPFSSFFGRVAFTRVHEQRICRRDYEAKTNRAIALMSRDTRSTSTCTPSASVEVTLVGHTSAWCREAAPFHDSPRSHSAVLPKSNPPLTQSCWGSERSVGGDNCAVLAADEQGV